MEYLFRGKRIDDGEWAYGYYYHNKKYDEHIIYDPMENITQKVAHDTVGQYTGLCDKNGKRIFEGDIILWGDRIARERKTALHVVVEFRSGCFGILDGKHFHEFWQYYAEKWCACEITDDMWGELPISEYFRACFEVIGNIHDTPEMLEVGK